MIWATVICLLWHYSSLMGLVHSSCRLWALILLDLAVSVQLTLWAQAEHQFAVTHKDHLSLWHHDSAVPGLLAEMQYCTHWGTIQIGSITNASLRVRQWSGPASWCGIGVLAISSCLVWHLWMLAQSFFLGPSSWWFPHAFCRSWDPELRFILGISFLICFTQELIPGYVLYVQRLSLLFTPCLSDS